MVAEEAGLQPGWATYPTNGRDCGIIRGKTRKMEVGGITVACL